MAETHIYIIIIMLTPTNTGSSDHLQTMSSLYLGELKQSETVGVHLLRTEVVSILT